MYSDGDGNKGLGCCQTLMEGVIGEALLGGERCPGQGVSGTRGSSLAEAGLLPSGYNQAILSSRLSQPFL